MLGSPPAVLLRPSNESARCAIPEQRAQVDDKDKDKGGKADARGASPVVARPRPQVRGSGLGRVGVPGSGLPGRDAHH